MRNAVRMYTARTESYMIYLAAPTMMSTTRMIAAVSRDRDPRLLRPPLNRANQCIGLSIVQESIWTSEPTPTTGSPRMNRWKSRRKRPGGEEGCWRNGMRAEEREVNSESASNKSPVSSWMIPSTTRIRSRATSYEYVHDVYQ